MLKIRIRVALLLVFTMLATLGQGMGMADAADVALTIPVLQVNDGIASFNAIQIMEKQIGDIQPGQMISITLPEDASYVTNPSHASSYGKSAYFNIPTQLEQGPGKALITNGLQPGDVAIDAGSTAQTLVLKVLKRSNLSHYAGINLSFSQKLTHRDPDLGLIIDGDSHIRVSGETAGFNIIIQNSSDAAMLEAYILPAGTFVNGLSCPKVKSGEQKLDIIRIVENVEGALIPDGMKGAGTVTLTLPKGYKWISVGLNPSGGFTSIGKVSINTDRYGRSIASFTITSASNGNAGIIDISPVVNIDDGAPQGNIVAAIGGTNAHITPANVAIGCVSSGGITCTSSGGSRIYAGCADALIGTLVLHENCPGSLIEGRALYLELPQGCRWVSVPVPVTIRGGCTLMSNGIINNGQIASYTVVSSSSGIESVIEFRQGSVSVPPTFPTGDFNISFGGTAF